MKNGVAGDTDCLAQRITSIIYKMVTQCCIYGTILVHYILSTTCLTVIYLFMGHLFILSLLILNLFIGFGTSRVPVELSESHEQSQYFAKNFSASNFGEVQI